MQVIVKDQKISLRTAASIRALLARLGPLPANYDRVHFDSALPGYGLRVRGSGVHSFMVQYGRAGVSRRIVLGKLGSIDPGKAYAGAKDLLAQVRLGRDPATEREHERARELETFIALLPGFLERQRAKQKPRSFEETERHLTKHCEPFHRRPVASLDRRTIGARLAEIAKHSGPAAANRVRASLSAFYMWLARAGHVDANPVAFTNKAIEGGAREHVPSDDELGIIWRALEPGGQYGAIVRLLLLTGARRDEIGSLCWSEVDLDEAVITLPPARTKNRREHVIPLSAPALTLLAAQPRRENPDGTPRDHVFGNGRGRGFQDWSGSKAELDARIAQAGSRVEDWTLHDFRRALSTALHDRFNVPPHVVEVILGHAGGHKSGVAGVYNKALYLEERRRALERWGAHIMELAGDTPRKDKVVHLRRRRK
jgi:integrase